MAEGHNIPQSVSACSFIQVYIESVQPLWSCKLPTYDRFQALYVRATGGWRWLLCM